MILRKSADSPWTDKFEDPFFKIDCRPVKDDNKIAL